MHCLVLYENYLDFSKGTKNKIYVHKCFAIYKTWQFVPNTKKCNSIELKQIVLLEKWGQNFSTTSIEKILYSTQLKINWNKSRINYIQGFTMRYILKIICYFFPLSKYLMDYFKWYHSDKNGSI
jgi:hypothetical protein